MAKSFDTYAPIGPVIATPDELGDPDDLVVRCRLNGTVVQEGRTRDMIHPVPELIAWASRVCRLVPGDLLFTGTPAGVGIAQDPVRFLRAGDQLVTEVEGVGTMRNTISVAD
jgi:2,4-didehydro-3-deoxy-L-rhamnonate hydrolase